MSFANAVRSTCFKNTPRSYPNSNQSLYCHPHLANPLASPLLVLPLVPDPLPLLPPLLQPPLLTSPRSRSRSSMGNYTGTSLLPVFSLIFQPILLSCTLDSWKTKAGTKKGFFSRADSGNRGFGSNKRTSSSFSARVHSCRAFSWRGYRSSRSIVGSWASWSRI